MKDLGVWLDDRLSFTLHYDEAISKDYGTLGLLRRIGSDFSDPICLRALYCSLVRPILEFANIVWSPSSSSSILKFERVQKAFTRFAFRKIFGSGYQLPPYYVRLQLLRLDSLESRRIQA